MKKTTVIISVLLVVLLVTPVEADIYLRVENGDISLTNAPSGEGYVLVLSQEGKEGEKFDQPESLQRAIDRAENKHHIPESIIFAVMTAGENVGVESNNIMALPPAVYGEMNDTLARDQWHNIDRGTARLREMLGYFEGNFTLALGAYFTSKQQVEEVGGVPSDSRVRKLVDRSQENFEEYRGKSPAIITYEDKQGVLHLISIL
ncbi:MAG: hypothetical protein ACQEP7_02360 [bacterium]